MTALATPLPLPLDERTNSPTDEVFSPQPLYPLSLRRNHGNKIQCIDQPLRGQNGDLKSDSDSLSSPSDAIYNASPVNSDEARGENSPSMWGGDEDKPVVFSVPRSSPPLGHSQWPPPLLDTIVEYHGSLRSLHRSISAPRLRLCPDLFLHSRQEKSPSPSARSSSACSQQHLRSMSLNDLDCVGEIDSQANAAATACTSETATSLEVLQAVRHGPSYPAKPVSEPVKQTPTPPGLPSFGSRDAQVIRLVADRDGRRRRRLFSSWLAPNIGTIECDEGGASRPGPVSQEHGLSEVLLRRLLGASGKTRIVSAPLADQNGQARVCLPPGIVATSETRALTVADDGTQVRGIFGHRQSGHGIGMREIHSHPLGRLNQCAAIEEEVRRIDKACAEMDRMANASRLEQLPTVPQPSLDAELERRLRGSCRRRSGSATDVTLSPADDHQPPVAPANSAANTRANTPILPEPRDYAQPESRPCGADAVIEHDGDVRRRSRWCSLAICLGDCDDITQDGEGDGDGYRYHHRRRNAQEPARARWLAVLR